jgi:adenylate cyclase
MSDEPSSADRRSLDLERFNELLLESTGVGLALLDARSLEVLFRNRRFSDWFPAPVEERQGLTDVFPDLDVGKMRERHEGGGVFKAETETKIGRRKVSLALHLSRPEDDAIGYVVLECQNITKLKELEYMVESYSNMIEKQNRSLQREKERAERLVLNIMPRKVYEEMKTFGVTTPQRFDSASVVMLDFVDFTEMSVQQEPSALIAELNDIFTSFDQIAEQFGCERIKTIGDAYMAVCGVPEAATDHAQSIAKIALLFRRYLERRNASNPRQWQCRIGINSGPVIGSIVGVQKYVYDIFGPGVNLAARMETLSGPMEITLCEEMYRLIRDDFRFEERGQVEVKGFGTKRLYTLVDEIGRGPAGGRHDW